MKDLDIIQKNERNSFHKIIDRTKQKDIEKTFLRHAPSNDFNHQIMKKMHPTQLDFEKA